MQIRISSSQLPRLLSEHRYNQSFSLRIKVLVPWKEDEVWVGMYKLSPSQGEVYEFWLCGLLCSSNTWDRRWRCSMQKLHSKKPGIEYPVFGRWSEVVLLKTVLVPIATWKASTRFEEYKAYIGPLDACGNTIGCDSCAIEYFRSQPCGNRTYQHWQYWETASTVSFDRPQRSFGLMGGSCFDTSWTDPADLWMNFQWNTDIESPFGELTWSMNDDLNPLTMDHIPVNTIAAEQQSAITNDDSQEVCPCWNKTKTWLTLT